MRRKIILIAFLVISVILFKKGTDIERREWIVESLSEVIAQNAESFLPRLENRTIKTDFKGAAVEVYSYEAVLDQSGVKYPYSFLVQNQYTIEVSGDRVEYLMVLGYRSEKDIKDFKGHCLKYLSETGRDYNEFESEGL